MSLLACRINGVERRELEIGDRAIQYGDGLFETLAVREGRVEFLTEHLARLSDGASRLGLPAPDPALWRADIQALLEDSRVERAVLKLLLSRGSGGRGYQVPETPTVSRVALLFPWPEHPPEYAEQGVGVRFCATPLAIQPRLAGLKHLNRLEQVLARQEWQDTTIQEGLMLDTQQRVVEGTMSNLFWVKGDRLHTPDLSDCGVRGIMREQVIRLAQQLGITMEIGEYQRPIVEAADGLFLTNSVIGLWPVRQLEAIAFPSNPLITRLQEQLDALRRQHAESDV